LEGCGLGAIALPFLRTAAGAAPAGTKRLLVVASANGTAMKDFFPATPDGPYPAILKPLEAYRAKLNVMRGLNMDSAYKAPVPKDHLPDNANMLIARQASPEGKVGGISIDQHIANAIGARTKFASLHFGVKVGGYAAYISARGVGQGVFPENSPQKAFDRAFKDVVADPADLARLRAEKKSMLDALNGELRDLRCALGNDERLKLDAHAESLRELEKSLAVTVAADCKAPAAPVAPAATDVSALQVQIRQHMDLMVAAAACDLTRVMTLQLGNGSGGLGAYRWIGLEGTHHGISHGSEGVTAPQAQRDTWITQIETWNAEQFAYLVGKLDALKENGGTLLDSTATLWAHEQSNGGSHQRRDMPWVMAGGMAGAFKTGRAINFGKSHNGLLISLANGMGVPTDQFGDPDLPKGPLAGL
jgi:hypothetical protein